MRAIRSLHARAAAYAVNAGRQDDQLGRCLVFSDAFGHELRQRMWRAFQDEEEFTERTLDDIFVEELATELTGLDEADLEALDITTDEALPLEALALEDLSQLTGEELEATEDIRPVR